MTIAKPTQVATPFANSGLKNSIPQSATGSNLASLEEGFPAVTMTAVGDGGTPPQGQDFNGVLYQVTNQLRYAQAGGLYPYNSTFCTAIGGYPLGAVLMSADGTKLWQNQTAGNTNNPDSDDTNWLELCTVDALTAGLSTKQGTLTFDSTPTAASTNPVTSGGVKTALDAKQDTLTFDTTPTANSDNPVTSDGIADALDGKLSLTGGTLTGDIVFNKTGALITRYGVYSIFGIDATNNQVYVSCADGTKYLRLGDGGEMKWAGHEVERVSSGSLSSTGSGYIRYESGLQICWSYQSLNRSVAGNGYNTFTWTYPVSFNSTWSVFANPRHDRFNAGTNNASKTSATMYYTNISASTYTIPGIDMLVIGSWK